MNSRRTAWWMMAWPVALLLGAVLLAAACGDDDEDLPDEVQLTEANNGETVAVARDGTLVVALASNPSTGYSWSVAEPGTDVVVLRGEPAYVPPGSTSPVVGAAGTQVFTFDVAKAGKGELKLEYRRPFEPAAAPERTFTVTIDAR